MHVCARVCVRIGRRRAGRPGDGASRARGGSPGRLRGAGEPRPGAGARRAVVLGPAGALDAVRHQDHADRPLGDTHHAGRARDGPPGAARLRQGAPDPL